jgi:hypothetical protein
MAALLLAQMGFRPLILERGKVVRERTKDTWQFWRKSILHPESNVQYGEGGAGTLLQIGLELVCLGAARALKALRDQRRHDAGLLLMTRRDVPELLADGECPNSPPGWHPVQGAIDPGIGELTREQTLQPEHILVAQYSLGRCIQSREGRFGNRRETPLNAPIQDSLHHRTKLNLHGWDARGGKIIPKTKQVLSISSAPRGCISHHQRT